MTRLSPCAAQFAALDPSDNPACGHGGNNTLSPAPARMPVLFDNLSGFKVLQLEGTRTAARASSPQAPMFTMPRTYLSSLSFDNRGRRSGSSVCARQPSSAAHRQGLQTVQSSPEGAGRSRAPLIQCSLCPEPLGINRCRLFARTIDPTWKGQRQDGLPTERGNPAQAL